MGSQISVYYTRGYSFICDRFYPQVSVGMGIFVTPTSSPEYVRFQPNQLKIELQIFFTIRQEKKKQMILKLKSLKQNIQHCW